MTTITIDLDDELAKQVEEAARREHKSVAEWAKERMRPERDLQSVALANGYPPGWTTLYASLAADESFAAPPRSSSRPIPGLD
jgi:hypothetical protein